MTKNKKKKSFSQTHVSINIKKRKKSLERRKIIQKSTQNTYCEHERNFRLQRLENAKRKNKHKNKTVNGLSNT